MRFCLSMLVCVSMCHFCLAFSDLFKGIGIAAGMTAMSLNVDIPSTRQMSSTSTFLVSESFGEKDLDRLKQGEKQIDYLLNNWRKKTTYCNFGEFNNELLDPANKKKLMDCRWRP